MDKFITRKIEQIIAPTLSDLGFELVRVLVTGSHNPTLQVMAERPADGSLGVDECEEISHAISAVLDVENPFPDAYTLEVSSPGIDRPLTRPKDFERYKGFEAKVELETPINGRKRFSGILTGLDGELVTVKTEEGDAQFPFSAIDKAKLVLTDELVRQHLKASEKKDMTTFKD